MKKILQLLIILLLFLSITLLCTSTIPSKTQYISWAQKYCLTHAEVTNAPLKDVFSQLLTPSIIALHTTDTNYVFFTLYESQIGTKGFKAIGLLNTFIPIPS